MGLIVSWVGNRNKKRSFQFFSSIGITYYITYNIDVGKLPIIVNISVFNALSIGSGPVAAVKLCIKRDDIRIKKIGTDYSDRL